MTSHSTEYLIVDGGIGGLTTAVALALARSGRPVRVLERASAFTEIGAGLQLAPNATHILDRLGVLKQITDAEVLSAWLALADAMTGEHLCSLDLGKHSQERFGEPYVVLSRSDLLAILLKVCQDHGVALETDRTVRLVDNRDHGATVFCADGRLRRRAVIACDGLRSTVRAQFSDDEAICSG
ncbi:FAD-dependent monooxygenase [Streptomyces sp. NBC_01643]|uniref:FAD-dependent monooxygenase n=1 Tax=Streptomyces sp. NBC_01643 TaxID=2975906 RepID=UPI002F91253B|nr:FAD-dependent monooxygenase [Streptomyces sp. NBC_01643]